MSPEDMQAVCATLREGGCRSVHIGGGEPFLDFNGLVTLVKTARRNGIAVDYIETNGYWANNEEKVKSQLQALLDAGTDTLCISVDPFHAEYVPYSAPLRLAQWCRRYSFGHFLWQERFLPMMRNLPGDTAHNRADLGKGISKEYIRETAISYGISYGGRAVNIAEEYFPPKPVDEITDSKPCHGLLSTNHFHVDMYGRFIPPGCTGIAIPLEEGIRGIPAGKYPAFEALLNGGVAALLEYGIKRGFVPNKEGYATGCVMCFHIRHWLSQQECCPELDLEHYEESLRYYSNGL